MLRDRDDPGPAVHHHSARKTRVNALMVLHRIREKRKINVTDIDTRLLTCVPFIVTLADTLAPVKDAIRRHRLAERVRFPRVEARHLRSRAAPG